MKKLMIVAAVAMAAFASQAAQVAWQMTATKADAAAGNGLTVYMILADDWQDSWENVKELTDASVKNAPFTVGAKSATSSVATYVSGDVSIGDNVSYYLAMVDAANDRYYASDLIKSSAATADGVNDKDGTGALIPAATPTTDKWAVGSGLATDANWKKFGGGDVPEPTSAMLILLGVAGLALKRKQA